MGALTKEISYRNGWQTRIRLLILIAQFLQENPILEDYISIQMRILWNRIHRVEASLGRPSTYTSDVEFAEAYTRAKTVKRRLKEFRQIARRVIREIRIDPLYLLNRFAPPPRTDNAISTRLRLSKLRGILTRQRALRELTREILALSGYMTLLANTVKEYRLFE